MIGKTSESGTTLNSRRGTGLRNRWRNGRSTYSIKRKNRQADIYGTFINGRQTKPDVIAGHTMWSVRAEALRGL